MDDALTRILLRAERDLHADTKGDNTKVSKFGTGDNDTLKKSAPKK